MAIFSASVRASPIVAYLMIETIIAMDRNATYHRILDLTSSLFDTIIMDLDATFTKTWATVKDKLDIEMLDHDEFWRWWPTIIQHQPNLEVLVQNLRELPGSPYLSFLTVYYYGFAAALEAMDHETVRVLAQDDEPVPPWLEAEWLAKLADEYRDKH